MFALSENLARSSPPPATPLPQMTQQTPTAQRIMFTSARMAKRGLFGHHKVNGHDDDDNDAKRKDTAGTESTSRNDEATSILGDLLSKITGASKSQDVVTATSSTSEAEINVSARQTSPATTSTGDGDDDSGNGLGKITNIIKGTKLTELLPSESTTPPSTLTTSTVSHTATLTSLTSTADIATTCTPDAAYPLPGATAFPESSSPLCKTIEHQANTINIMIGTVVALAVLLVLGPLVAWGFWKKLRRPRRGHGPMSSSAAHQPDIEDKPPTTFRNSFLGGLGKGKMSKEQQAQNRVSALMEMEMPEIQPRRRPPPPPPAPPLPPPPAEVRPSSTAANIAAQIRRGARPASSVYSQ